MKILQDYEKTFKDNNIALNSIINVNECGNLYNYLEKNNLFDTLMTEPQCVLEAVGYNVFYDSLNDTYKVQGSTSIMLDDESDVVEHIENKMASKNLIYLARFDKKTSERTHYSEWFAAESIESLMEKVSDKLIDKVSRKKLSFV